MNFWESPEILASIATVIGSVLAALLSREGLFRWKRKNDVTHKLANIYGPLNYEIIRLKAADFSSAECKRTIERSDEILSKYSHLVPMELINSYAKMITDIDLKASPSFGDFCYIVRHQYDQCQAMVNGNKPYFSKTKVLKSVLIYSLLLSTITTGFLLLMAFIWRDKNSFLKNPGFNLVLIVLAFLATFLSTSVSGYSERSSRLKKKLSLPSSKASNRSS